MTNSARIDVSYPLEDLVRAKLDAPADSQWRREPLGSDVINGQAISDGRRALRWTNDLDDRIVAALSEFGCEHTDGGVGWGVRDVGYSVDVTRRDEAYRRLLDFLAANADVPAGTSVSVSVYDDSYDQIGEGQDTTVGEHRASPA